jgi:hypothetical protein
MGKGEPGGAVCSASAQRRLPIPAMTPLVSRAGEVFGKERGGWHHRL